MSRAGMSLAERQAARQRYREQAITRAARIGLSLRCQDLMDDLDNPAHQLCRGEDPGNCGCLCRCHDNPGFVVVGRRDERVA